MAEFFFLFLRFLLAEELIRWRSWGSRERKGMVGDRFLWHSKSSKTSIRFQIFSKALSGGE